MRSDYDKIEGGWDDAGSVLVDLLEVTVSPSVGIVRRYKAFESSCQILGIERVSGVMMVEP